MTQIKSINSLDAQGRLPGTPVAILDIGSNSVRLVIFERAARAPTTLFNEKLLAGLGRGLSTSGRLEDEAVERTVSAIGRYRLLTQNASVGRIHVLATAATREAENGKAFVAEVERKIGAKVTILSGKEEAHYAALGVVAGVWHPSGLAADMGGGSLEVVDVDDHAVGAGETFPLGSLRLTDDAEGKISNAVKIADKHLKGADVLTNCAGKSIYAIGGTWRSLARLHMVRNDYPLHVMHNYTVPAAEFADFCETLFVNDATRIDDIEAVSRNRRALLPYGAVVMQKLMEHSRAVDMVVSAYGVREGYLFSTLTKKERERDPLLASCVELTQLRARSVAHVHELTGWSDQLFAAIEMPETDDEVRLRHAACLLADIGWRAHPDYRGEESLTAIAHASLSGIAHSGRAFLALAVYYRYAGLAEPEIAVERQFLQLITPRLITRARILASGMRLAYVLSAAMPGTLGACRIEKIDDQSIQVVLPKSLRDLDGERFRKRCQHLTREIGRSIDVAIDD